MSINDAIKNAMLASGIDYATNAPYSPENQYAAGETKLFYAQNLRWSSNRFAAQIQGFDYNDFYAWTDTYIRVSNVVDSATGQTFSDDWQRIIVDDIVMDFIPVGAKVVFNGSTWIVDNPSNVASVVGTAIVRRCNTVWNTLDYYGNIVSEPMVFAKGMALATANDYADYIVSPDSYQHAIMQKNSNTLAVTNNDRVLLGSRAFYVRGMVDFIREFTDNGDSIHEMKFDLTVTEPNETDDTVNGVANGLNFSWIVAVSGNPIMTVGNTETLTAESLRNGEAPTEAASYTWTSSDETIATVTDGAVTGVAAGAAVITAALAENPTKTGTFTVTVQAAVSTDYVDFTSAVPDSLTQYSSATLTAALYRNGQAVADTVTWSFTGAETGSYGATVSGNSATIECCAASNAPLTVNISAGGCVRSAQIELYGM